MKCCREKLWEKCLMTFDRKIKIDYSTVLMICSVHSTRGPVYHNIKLSKYDFTHFSIPICLIIHMIFVDLCVIVYFTQKNPTRCNSVSNFFFIFIWSSTCFGRHTHPQEPKTVLAASGFAYMEGCWPCRCWKLTASSNYMASNPPRMQNQSLLVQF